jgi:hypothetical protein
VRTSKWLIAAASCCLAFSTNSAQGCQYNVREVGFIDVGIEAYRLWVYVPESTSADGVSSLKQAMDVALAETNIRFEPVTVGADANQAAMEFAKTHGISRFPAAVLVSPDGQSMPVALPEKVASLAEAVVSALGGILGSPVRQQILEKSADTYGVVLLIEGPEQRANAAAREAISAAISRIGDQLEFLPKPIKRPPELVVLDQKSLTREQVLLWTLRVKAEDVNQPHAAVFYGRGHWIGPLFEGETLTADNLTQLLSVIGEDCECSLDHRWLQGTMLPARWDETLQQKVTQSLGFDPESPMTKMEMVSIIRRGMGGFDYPGVPFEYREIEVGGDDAEARGQPGLRNAAQARGAERPEAEGQSLQSPISSPQPQESPASHPQSAIVGQVLAASLVGMATLIGVTSLAIILRARKE